MKKVPINEVREKMAKYLAEAAHGEEIIITKHNKPIAKLVSYEEPKKPKFPDMTEFRNQFRNDSPTVLELLLDERNQDRF